MSRGSTQRQQVRRNRPGVAGQREIILQAAMTLFSERGTAAVSVSEICRAAGVSRDTFYRCFEHKDALLESLYSSVVKRHMQAVITAPDLDYADPEWVSRAVDQAVDAILAQAAVARFLFVESGIADSPASAIVDRAFDLVARRMRAWVANRVAAPPPLDYFKSLLVAAHGLGERQG
jgi:AcrR family transcriptional regulator